MSFTAQYRGTCGECDGPILVGQEVDYTTELYIIHRECPDDLKPSATGFCSVCFLELPTSGVCGVCD